jgi:glycosyltransferase involved in cell wall biosynthesis
MKNSGQFADEIEVAANLRVLVVAPEPFYEDRGTPISVRYLLEALSEIGFAVDLLTYPVGESIPIPGVQYIRVGNPFGFRSVPIGLSGHKLFLDLLLTFRLMQVLRRGRYICVHAVEEMAFLASLIARRRGIPVVYDMQSSIPEQLKQHRLLRIPPLPVLFRAAERWLLSRVDGLICSAGLKDRVRRINGDIVMSEWRFPGERARDVAPSSDELRESLQIPAGSRVVMYCGTFERYQGLDNLRRAMPRVLGQAPDAIFVVIGARNSDELDAFRRALEPAVADRVRVLERCARDRVPAYLAMADVLVSPREIGANVPLKIFDYLAAGKAIVASDIPAHSRVIDKRCAVLAPPTPEGLAAAIVGLLKDPSRAGDLGDAARSYADTTLGWYQFVQRIRGIYDPIGALVPAVSRGPGGEL